MLHIACCLPFKVDMASVSRGGQAGQSYIPDPEPSISETNNKHQKGISAQMGTTARV
jgi:hypothetical protein